MGGLVVWEERKEGGGVGIKKFEEGEEEVVKEIMVYD